MGTRTEGIALSLRQIIVARYTLNNQRLPEDVLGILREAATLLTELGALERQESMSQAEARRKERQ